MGCMIFSEEYYSTRIPYCRRCTHLCREDCGLRCFPLLVQQTNHKDWLLGWFGKDDIDYSTIPGKGARG